MIWYTSDTHFWHANVIDYCQRPFSSLEDMHEQMIARWNARVKPDDVVIHIGDFAFGNREKKRAVIERLHGDKVIVLGNHDPSATQMEQLGFVTAKREYRVSDGPYLLYLRHEPNMAFDAKEFDFHLCGHVHEAWRTSPENSRIINVGVDQWNFEPQRIEDLVRLS